MNSSANLRILVIENDIRATEELRSGLQERGHTVVTATNAADGLRAVETTTFDAIVVHIGLPDRSGLTTALSLQPRKSRPVVVMLTEANDGVPALSGGNAGADECIAKPIVFPDLADRIVACVRRLRPGRADHFWFGAYQLNLQKHRLYRENVEVAISRSEYLLLRALAIHRGEVISRRQLMQVVWGSSTMSHGMLDTLVSAVRYKIEDHAVGRISMVQGVGYRLLDDADVPKSGPDTVQDGPETITKPAP